ncbi:MAG TPA: glycoside hydrolase family 76 protein, partial [Streptosporangiaceae bacterium]|nr:glycoside hydrolase family 76 protein [Streptosporangiaceae bacterium]
ATPATPAARARLLPCTGQGQRWHVENQHQIQLQGTGNCLAPANSQPKQDTALTLTRCTPRAAIQRWIIPASTPVSRTLSVVSRLLTDYNYAGHGAGLFTSDTDPVTTSCSNVYRRGNCWWWSAIALYALTDFAEQAPTATITVDSIKTVLAHTYAVMCGSTCPASPNPAWPGSSQDNLPVNFANRYYDDTGWWALTWANAYRLTGNPRYLYLAEDLWSFLTRFAWDKACGGALMQHEGKNRRGVASTQDTTSNVLYLRLSAWLYSLAAPGNRAAAQKYLVGTGKVGGARAVARWLAGSAGHPGTATEAPSKLISGPYRSILHPNAPSRPVASPGSRFMILGHLDRSCKAFGGQMWLHTQSVAVAAFTDLAAADKLAGDHADASYYSRLAANLADTVTTNKPEPGQSPPADIGSYFTPGHRPITPPTTNRAGILSEPCLPTVGNASWPAGCRISFTLRSGGKSSRADAPYLPNKGIFIRGAYCVTQTQPDPALARFISANAASVWRHAQDTQLAPTPSTKDNLFGFRWDGSFAANDVPLNFTLETSALEALDAGLGGSTAMC